MGVFEYVKLVVIVAGKQVDVTQPPCTFVHHASRLSDVRRKMEEQTSLCTRRTSIIKGRII